MWICNHGIVKCLLTGIMCLVWHILIASLFDPSPKFAKHGSYNDGQYSCNSKKGGSWNKHSSAFILKNRLLYTISLAATRGIRGAAVSIQINALSRAQGRILGFQGYGRWWMERWSKGGFLCSCRWLIPKKMYEIAWIGPWAALLL